MKDKSRFKETEIGMIPEDWEALPLLEVSINFDKQRVPLSSRERDSKKGNYPYYGAQGIIDYVNDYIYDGDHILIAEDGENLRSKKEKIANFATGKFWVNNHAHVIKNSSNSYLKFLFYSLNSIDITPYLSGSVQPKLNQENLNRIKLAIPSLLEQIRIAKILSDLDDKIELSQQMNKTLEAIGQAIFKRWFVDCKSPASSGWQVDELGKHIEFFKGKKPSKISEIYSVGYRPQILIENLNGNPSSYTNENGMIAVEIDEPIMVMDGASSGRVEIGHDGILGSTLAKIIVTSGRISNLFLYYFLKGKESDINQNTTGTSIPHTDKEKIKKYQCNLPPKDLLKSFNDIAIKFLHRIIVNKNEIKTLAKIRDSLLPRLMSGKIRVNMESGG